ncbi:MAG: hypothetical protein Q9215_006859 [Flavoplaca cf. flavocitrina]
MSKTLLITGATGKQGRACIESLLSSPSPSSFKILALTRNASSPSATRLAQRAPQIQLIQGDLNDCPRIFDSISQPVHGVFGMTTPMGGKEEEQGKALVDASVEAGVKQFVFTSVERGGQEKSWENPTKVPHFLTKHNIEQHMLEKIKAATATGADPMRWTILRPVAFMDNLQPGLLGKLFASAWKVTLPPSQNRKIQLIATEDVGWFAAQAFLKPEEYADRAISLAGDEISYAEADEVFRSKLGYNMPLTLGPLARFGLWASRDLGTMFDFFREEGFGVDVDGLRRMNPGMMRFAEWVEKKRRTS